MRRTDTLLAAIVATFAVFVGVQVARRPVPSVKRPSTLTADSGSSDAAHAEADRSSGDVAASRITSAASAPARDLDAIRATIAAAGDSYMPEMLDDLKGQLVRWPDRGMQALRVWVQAATTIPGWDGRDQTLARDAFTDWQQGGSGGPPPLRFDFVLDSAGSDIQVAWIDRFPPAMGLKVGSTQRTTDQNGWIVGANVVVALHDSAGNPLTPGELAGVVRHEAGHALGMGHSRNPATLMYPTERVTDIQPLDRATLLLLYTLPPGPAR